MSLIKWFFAWVLSGIAMLFGAGWAAGESRPPHGVLGDKIVLPTLNDADGKRVNPPADKPFVVAFLSFECPVARDYLTTLSNLADEYGKKGAAFVGYIPMDDSAADVARQAREFKATFPILSDRKQEGVAALKAGHTPEVFLLDSKGVLRYRGRIDDKYGARLKPNARISRHDLREALDEVLAGKPVSVPSSPVVGCPIPPLRGVALDGKVTYYRDVLPIVQNRCQECHRPGDVGPFSLMTYKQAVTWAEDIKEYTASRKMPPWKPVDGVKFQHDRRMSVQEIKTLAAWVDAGTPEGNEKDAPPAKTFAKGWALGEPDLVLEMESEMHLAANGPDHFRCVVMPTGLKEDKFVVAYEVKPGNPKIVHHSVNYFDTTGTARRMAREAKSTGDDRGPGYESPMGIGFTPKDISEIGGLGGWTPGMRGVRSHAGTGMVLPKGADVVLQLHYHRTGKPETDRTKIGLYFAKEKDLKPLKILIVPGLVSPSNDYRDFDTIPAGHSSFKVAGRVVVEEDCDIYTCLPHMHMLGSKIKVTVTPPGGKEQPIVTIDQWDYNWQEVYHFEKALPIKAGTIISVEGEFDNSAANPHNPSSPPQAVKKGEGTTDEMLFAFLRATSNHSGDIKLRSLTAKSDYTRKVK